MEIYCHLKGHYAKISTVSIVKHRKPSTWDQQCNVTWVSIRFLEVAGHLPFHVCEATVVHILLLNKISTENRWVEHQAALRWKGSDHSASFGCLKYLADKFGCERSAVFPAQPKTHWALFTRSRTLVALNLAVSCSEWGWSLLLRLSRVGVHERGCFLSVRPVSWDECLRQQMDELESHKVFCKLAIWAAWICLCLCTTKWNPSDTGHNLSESSLCFYPAGTVSTELDTTLMKAAVWGQRSALTAVNISAYMLMERKDTQCSRAPWQWFQRQRGLFTSEYPIRLCCSDATDAHCWCSYITVIKVKLIRLGPSESPGNVTFPTFCVLKYIFLFPFLSHSKAFKSRLCWWFSHWFSCFFNHLFTFFFPSQWSQLKVQFKLPIVARTDILNV